MTSSASRVRRARRTVAAAAVTAGMLMALKPAFLRRGRLEVRAIHEALSLATFALIAVHAIALFADPVLEPGIVGTLVPFGAGYRPVATALGQIAAYGMIGLGSRSTPGAGSALSAGAAPTEPSPSSGCSPSRMGSRRARIR